MDWRWIFWQIVVPVFGPTLIALAVAVAWMSLEPTFSIRWAVVVDITPWATTFYCITLVCSTMHALWERIVASETVGAEFYNRFTSLMMIASAVVLYNALTVIKRHDPSFAAPSAAYWVTAVLMIVSVVLSYRGHLVAQSPT